MFSVIIPLYNKKPFVERAVQSVLSQRFESFELIIVDDGSVDGGADVVTQTFSDNRIQLIKQRNRGVSAARNKGILYSHCPYIAFLDADDYWDREYLKNMKELVTDYPQARLFGANYYEALSDKIKISKTWLPDEYRGYLTDYFENALTHYLFSSSSSIVERNSLFETGLFDERVNSGEDLDMWFRLILKQRVAFYNKPLVYYTNDDKNASTKKLPSFNKHLVYYIVEKYYQSVLPMPVKKFFDYYLLLNLRPYYLTNNDKRIIKMIYANINRSNRPLRYNWIYILPISFVKIVYKPWKWLKGAWNHNLLEIIPF